MSIYVVRHGQTDYNEKNIFQGHKDIPLNKEGILQAKEMAKLFEHINIDIMLVSPLTRTRQTAKYINEIVKTEMIIENRLIERNYGKMEGKTNRPDWNNIMMLDYNANYDNEDIEPIQELFKRIFSFLDETIQKFKDKNILLVTHGAVSQAIECYFKGMPELANFESLEPLALKTGQFRKYSDILIEQKIKELDLKLFTIVIPTYNSENFIQEAVESALNQDFKNYEIIIVDDDSCDNTAKILNKYKDIENVQIITHESNQKAGGARNTGMYNAKGKYILFLDADDRLISKDILNKLEKVIEKSNYPDVIYMGFEKSGEKHIPDEESDIINRLNQWEYPNVWDVLWNVEFIRKNNIYFENNKYYEDFLFYYKAIIQSTSYGIAPFVTHIYRSDNNSMTRGMNISKLKDYSYMITKALEFTETVDKKYEMALMNRINRNCYYFKQKLEEYIKDMG